MDEQALKLGVQTAEVYRDFVASQSKLSNKDAFNCFIASVIGCYIGILPQSEILAGIQAQVVVLQDNLYGAE